MHDYDITCHAVQLFIVLGAGMRQYQFNDQTTPLSCLLLTFFQAQNNYSISLTQPRSGFSQKKNNFIDLLV